MKTTGFVYQLALDVLLMLSQSVSVGPGGQPYIFTLGEILAICFYTFPIIHTVRGLTSN